MHAQAYFCLLQEPVYHGCATCLVLGAEELVQGPDGPGKSGEDSHVLVRGDVGEGLVEGLRGRFEG